MKSKNAPYQYNSNNIDSEKKLGKEEFQSHFRSVCKKDGGKQCISIISLKNRQIDYFKINNNL